MGNCSSNDTPEKNEKPKDITTKKPTDRIKTKRGKSIRNLKPFIEINKHQAQDADSYLYFSNMSEQFEVTDMGTSNEDLESILMAD
jgi:hypothetical protein